MSMASLIALLFNPTAWVVLGITTLLSFSTGVVKGWNASNADHWRAQAEEYRRSSERKDAIIAADAERERANLEDKTELEARLNDLIKASGDSCRLSDVELGRLRKLASAKRNGL